MSAKLRARRVRPFKWSPRREAFCREYQVDLNQTEAAKRAGFSARTAKEIGYELMQIPEIRARVQELMEKRAAKVELTAETVLSELLRLATVDVAGAYDDLGALLPIHDIPEDIRRAIAGVEVDEIKEWVTTNGKRTQEVVGYTRKVKFWDKRGSLELLGKYLKLFTDKVEHSADSSLEAIIARSWAPAAGTHA